MNNQLYTLIMKLMYILYYPNKTHIQYLENFINNFIIYSLITNNFFLLEKLELPVLHYGVDVKCAQLEFDAQISHPYRINIYFI